MRISGQSEVIILDKKVLDAVIVHMNIQLHYLKAGLSTHSEAVNFISGFLIALEESGAITEHHGKLILELFLSLT